MDLQICAQCFNVSDGYTTYVALQRGSFKAVYNLIVCWNCFDLYREMAHSIAYKWLRLEPELQVKLPLKLLE